MKLTRLCLSFAFVFGVLAGSGLAAEKRSDDGLWKFEDDVPAIKKGARPQTRAKKFNTIGVDLPRLKALLGKAPKEFSGDAKKRALILTLPMPDGSFARFQVEETDLLAPDLGKKFPQFKCYVGRGIDDPAATVRCDVTHLGFHAQILSPNGTTFIDPYSGQDEQFCIAYRKADLEVAPELFRCGTVGEAAATAPAPALIKSPGDGETVASKESPLQLSALTFGSTYRVYRLAVAATAQYTAFHSQLFGRSANVADGLAAIVTTVNRVSGVYERDLAIRLQLVGNNDQIVYTSSGSDPYNDSGGDAAAAAMLSANQTTLDNVIGSGNYDIGHLFCINGSPQAGANPYGTIGNVCIPGWKGQGLTSRRATAGGPIGDPFDIDYVAHEMGHQFGASHTFNSVAGACSGGTREPSTAYEPGSGTTIMAYAGICSDTTADDNVQVNSDAYFHFASLENIRNYVTTGVGYGDCPATSSSGNSIPTVNAGANYVIPGWTPFVLEANGSDSDGDTLTFTWEQRDKGAGRSLDSGDDGDGPIMRSLPGTTDGKRFFPRFANRGTNDSRGDIIPVASRTLNFRVTARDNRPIGAFATDDMQVQVVASAGPFYVQVPSSTGIVWPAGSYQNVEWEVNGTDQAPINCEDVEIWLSTNDGVSYDHQLAAFADNDGLERVRLPVFDSIQFQCRILVRGRNNIFFDVSDSSFIIGAAVAPNNDNKTNAQFIGAAASGSVNGTTLNASEEASEPGHFYQVPGPAYTGGRSVWYRWVPAQGGQVTFSLSSSEMFGVFAIYKTGSDWNGLSVPRLFDAHSTNTFTFTVPKDEELFIVVDGLHDQDYGTFTLNWNTIVDSTPPTITFTPLTNTQPVFDFSKLGGTVSEPAIVEFKIEQFAGNPTLFWNGTNWSSSPYWLPAVVTGTTWTPEAWTLPSRGQTIPATYLVHVRATDFARNITEANIALNRTQPDTTPPQLEILGVNGAVFTNNFLPQIGGQAIDPESGISTVNVLLSRSVAPGQQVYWTGSNWSEVPMNLAACLEGNVWHIGCGWNLPSGNNLPNALYTLAVSANNNEVPSGGTGKSVNFEVDYHPIHTWTAGSWSDSDPFNNNNLWANPANWDAGVPPTNAIVVINGGDPDARPLGSINIYGVTLNGGNLYTSGMAVRKLNVANGHLIGGTIALESNKGVFNFTGGDLSGTYNFLPGSVVNMSGADSKEFISGAVVNNQGTVNWNGGGPIYTYAYSAVDYSRFNNLSNGVFKVTTNGNLFAITHNPSFFYNEAGALFVKSAGTGTNTINSFHFYNRGETRVDAGTLLFNGNVYSENGSSFTGTETFLFQSGRLELRGTTTLNGSDFFFESGTVAGYPASKLLTTDGAAFHWTAGTFEGEIELTPGSRLNISGTTYKTLNSFARLRNFGEIHWSDTGEIYTYAYSAVDYSVIENFSGSVFVVTGNAPLTYTHNPSQFIVHPGASFQKLAGDGVTRSDWYFANNGTLLTESGSIQFTAGGTNSGTFLATAGASIRYTSGTHLWNGVDFGGTGKIQIDGGTVTRNGTISEAEESSGSATLELVSGIFNGTGDLTGDVVVHWLGGTVGGVLNVAPSVTFNATGTAAKSLASFTLFNNGGTFNWNGAGRIFSSAYSPGDFATFNNLSNAVFDLQTDGDVFSIEYNRSFFTNHVGGLVVKSGGTGTNFIDEFGFNNFGEIKITTGAICFRDIAKLGANTAVTGAGSLQVAGTVDLDTSLQSSATFALLSGTLNCSTNAAYVGSAPFDWTGGKIAGSLVLAGGATMNLSGITNKELNNFAVLHNRGTVNWSGPGRIYTYAYSAGDFAAFVNHSNATLNLLTDGTVFEITHNPSRLTNDVGAKIVKVGGSGTNAIHSFHVRNRGEIRADSGTIAFGDAMSLLDGSQLSGAGTIRFAGNTEMHGTLTAECNVSFDAGTFTGVATTNSIPTYTGAGPATWFGGTIAGTFKLAQGSVMNVSGPGTKTLNNLAVMHNHGVMNWSGPGTIHTYAYYPEDASVINNHNRFNVMNDGDVFDITHNRSFFTNHVTGIFAKTGGANQTVMNDFLFANRGEIKAEMGTIDFGSVLEIENDSRFTGNGALQLSAGNASLRGLLEVDGPVFRTSATFNNEGVIVPTVLTKNEGLFEWAGGSFNGRFTLSSGSTMRLSGTTKSLGDGAVMNNYGYMEWVSGEIHKYAYSPAERSYFTNHPGAVFMVTTNAPFTYTHNPSLFVNSSGATFRKKQSIGTTSCSWEFINEGTLDVESGTVRFDGALSAGANSVWNFTVGGPTPGAEYSQVSYAGSLLLRGQLNVALANLYLPSNGSLFTLISGGTRTGQFNSVNTPALPGDMEWNSVYSSGGFALRARQAPVCVPSDGLIAWWPGSGGTNLAGWYPLSPFNGATNGTGLKGDAFELNGGNQFWQAADVPTFRPTNLTVEGWANFASAGGVRVLFGKPYGNQYFNSFTVWHQDGLLRAIITAPDGFQSDLSYPFNPQLNTWYHVAFTYDQPAKTGTLYLDGAIVAQHTNSPGPIVYDDRPFVIGADIENGGYNFFFHGKIDEVGLYNRALSGAEIAAIYSADTLGRCPIPSPTPTFVSGLNPTNSTLLRLNFSAPGASQGIIEASTNLVNWLPLHTNAPFTGSASFEDVIDREKRFYRLVIVP